MPQALVYVGALMIKAWGWWAVALIVVGTAWGQSEQRKSDRDRLNAARDAYNAALKDRMATVINADAAHVYVYGFDVAVGARIADVYTSGDRDQYHHLVCVLADHQSAAINDIAINDKWLGALDANGFSTAAQPDFYYTRPVDVAESHSGAVFDLAHLPIGASLHVQYYDASPYVLAYVTEIPVSVVGTTVTMSSSRTWVCSYQWTEPTPRIRITKRLGAPGAGHDTRLAAECPSQYLTSSVWEGKTVLIIRIDLDCPELASGVPSIKARMDGKLVHDVRDPTYPLDIPACSGNNVLVITDYLTSPMCGVPMADLPLDNYIAEANVCDQSILIGGVSAARYTFCGTVSATEDQGPTLEMMANSMAGIICGTTWAVHVGAWSAPVMTLSQDDIKGDFCWVPGAGEDDLFNGVKGQYIAEENLFVPTDFKPYQVAAYLAADNGVEKWADINFPYTANLQRIHNICRIKMEYQRNAFTLQADLSWKAWDLEIGERITFDFPFLGQVGKYYQVVQVKRGQDQPVWVSLKEDDPSIYDEADAIVADATPNTNLTNPWQVDAIASLTCSSGTDVLQIGSDGSIISRILVEWPLATTQGVVHGGYIEVEWRTVDSAWNATQVTGDATSAHLSPVKDGDSYQVRVRAVNPQLNAKSIDTYTWHQVVGKSQRPPDMTDLSIAGDTLIWTPISRDTVPDLAGYVFRYHVGSNLDWGTAVNLHEGVVTASPFTPELMPFGAATIMGKAIDTTGNESLAAVHILTQLGDANINNVVETFDFGAGSYPGTQLNCALYLGDLVADDLDSFYGTDLQSFYGADADSFYTASNYAEMIYTTTTITPSAVLAGSLMTLLIETASIDQHIEYRKSDPTPGVWLTWPGQLEATTDDYELRVTFGAGPVQGQITSMQLIIDAPDITEVVSDLAIAATATAIPFTRPFTAIKGVQATLQANSSGAVTLEVNKTSPLAPTILAYNSAHTAVAGATADITLKGY